MKKYFYSDGTKEFGPFTIEELKEKGLTRETNVWFHELGEWKKAGTIPELKELFDFIPPPIKQSNDNIQLPVIQVNTNSTIDIFVFLAIVYWFSIVVIMFVIRQLIPNSYNTPWKYFQIFSNLIFAFVPIVFALSVRNKTLKIISIVFGTILSIYFLYSNIDWLIRELK
jgi:hypothetical protein